MKEMKAKEVIDSMETLDIVNIVTEYSATIEFEVEQDIRHIEGVRELLGHSCIKEENEKYIKVLYKMRRIFFFGNTSKEVYLLIERQDEETKKLIKGYIGEVVEKYFN